MEVNFLTSTWATPTKGMLSGSGEGFSRLSCTELPGVGLGLEGFAHFKLEGHPAGPQAQRGGEWAMSVPK